MPRATIRFPEDLHKAISAEADRRGKPWTFSSLVISDLTDIAVERYAEIGGPDPGTVGYSGRVSVERRRAATAERYARIPPHDPAAAETKRIG